MNKTNPYNIQLLSNQELSCGEGPLWDTESRSLFWTDCGGEAVYGMQPESGMISTLITGLQVGGLALHASGGLVLGGGKGFFHWKPGEGTRLISNRCGDIEVNHINDIIADPAGRVFGGQEAFREHQNYETGYLFRIDTDGSCSVAEEGMHLSNGMGFSPSCDRFYLVDSIRRTVYAYDYHLDTGQISNRTSLISFSREEGLPDGLTVDREGFIWVARWFGAAVSRYDPDGRLERNVELPAAQISSLTFGGESCKDIFVTSAASLWESPLAPPTHDFSTHRGGGVYRITQPIEGKPEFKAKV